MRPNLQPPSLSLRRFLLGPPFLGTSQIAYLAATEPIATSFKVLMNPTVGEGSHSGPRVINAVDAVDQSRTGNMSDKTAREVSTPLSRFAEKHSVVAFSELHRSEP